MNIDSIKGTCTDLSGKESKDHVQILHLIHSGAIGGGPKIVYALATYFSQGVWQSVVICSDDGPLKRELESKGIRVIPMKLEKKWRALFSIPALVRIIRSIKPQLIHLQGQFVGFVGGIAARLAGNSNVVYTAQFPSFITDWDLWRRLRNALVERLSCLCAKKIVCVSKWDQREYIRRRLVPERKTCVIYNGVVPEEFSGENIGNLSVEQMGFTQASPVLGFIGRLTDQKGVEVLLNAMPIVLDEYPHCVLLIAGDGPLKQSLQNLTHKLGIEQSVRFLGFYRDVPGFLAAVDLLVVPSLFEPLGIVSIEGMAAGKPVVASRVEGLIETIVDGVTGKLVTPKDPVALARSIVEILVDPEKVRAMGSEGKERVQFIFSSETMLKKYELLYRSLLCGDVSTENLKT